MNVYYCKMPDGNIGDDLNEYIWPFYLKNDDNDDSHLVVGIGSLLNINVPKAQKYTVISAGIGYGELPKVDENWTFLAVRGIYSKEALNLPASVIMIDGAYLLKDCYPKPVEIITNKVGYIPHVESLEYGDWEKVCELAGLQFIDPRLGLDEFLKLLCSCEKVIAEAMHGAIIADCYGIPWKPVKAYHHINTHKWNDWLSAFGETSKFSHISSVWYDIKLPGRKVLKNTIKKIIFAIYPYFNLTPPIYPKSNESDYVKCASELKTLLKEDFFLNDQSLVDEKVQLLKKKIHDYFA
jgi:hypothetical protein